MLSGHEPHRLPPLDYVPTTPVHKPRRAVRRGIRAGACAVTALAVAFFYPIAMFSLAAVGVFIVALQKLADWADKDD